MRAILHETIETVSLHWGVHNSTVKKWRQRILDKEPADASRLYKAARMRLLRTESPEKFVAPGFEHLADLSPDVRRSLGRRTAGSAVWDPSELQYLAEYSDTDAAKLLGRSISSVRNARHRYKVPHPSFMYECRLCGYQWDSYLNHQPKVCANRSCRKKLR
jgi:DNA-directed RNA polymerase specialized sigma24 family protein